MFPDLDQLAVLMTSLLKTNPDLAAQMGDHVFDVVSVKGYWDNKETNWHQDIQLNQDGTPSHNNSQIPGTPVAILMFGDTKNFWLGRKQFPREDNSKGPIPSTLVGYQQRHGAVTILDSRDETVREDQTTVIHMSDMEFHNKNGVAFSLLFRCSASRVMVHPTKNTLMNQKPMSKARQAISSFHFIIGKCYVVNFAKHSLTNAINNTTKPQMPCCIILYRSRTAIKGMSNNTTHINSVRQALLPRRFHNAPK